MKIQEENCLGLALGNTCLNPLMLGHKPAQNYPELSAAFNSTSSFYDRGGKDTADSLPPQPSFGS